MVKYQQGNHQQLVNELTEVPSSCCIYPTRVCFHSIILLFLFSFFLRL